MSKGGMMLFVYHNKKIIIALKIWVLKNHGGEEWVHDVINQNITDALY